MKRWHKITAVAGVGVLLFPRPAKALFGEDIPFLIQLVNQSIQDYRLARQAYDEMKRAGYYVTHINVRQLLFQSVNTATRNVYGETINWPMAMNNGSNVSGAWSRATVQVNPASWYRDDLAAQSSLASVETLDAAAQNAMAIHGQSLQQSTRLAGSIQNPTIQDQLEMQQVGNAGSNALLELQIAQAKVTRDQIAQHIAFMGEVEQKQKEQGVGLGSISESMKWVPQ